MAIARHSSRRAFAVACVAVAGPRASAAQNASRSPARGAGIQLGGGEGWGLRPDVICLRRRIRLVRLCVVVA